MFRRLELAPSWSHGSKLDHGSIIQALTGWLPRGAMDLNCERIGLKCFGFRWLPRGAMDLN